MVLKIREYGSITQSQSLETIRKFKIKNQCPANNTRLLNDLSNCLACVEVLDTIYCKILNEGSILRNRS